MIKKLLLLTIIFFGFFLNGNVLADSKDFKDLNSRYNKEEGLTPDELKRLNEYKNKYGHGDDAVEKMEKEEQIAKAAEDRKKDCANGTNGTKKGSCIDQASFEINTGDIFGGISATASATDTRTGTNMLLGTIIEKLMVALGILSVLIMTVGGGYIILYHGQDELLSKGKSIFMSGVVALVVALSSYMIVGLLRFILYNN